MLRRRTAPSRASRSRDAITASRSVSRLSAPNALTTCDAVEALVHGRAELAELVLRGVEVLVDASLVDDVEPDQQREHRHRGQPEPEVGDQQPHRRQDEHHHDAGGERQRAEHGGGGLGVDAGAGDEVAGALLAMPRRPAGRRPGRSTSAVSDSVTRHVVRPAHVRRTTTPAARTTPTTISSPRTATTVLAGDGALLEPRGDDVVDDAADDDRREHRARREHRGASRRR